MKMSIEEARRHWSHGQGLNRLRDDSVADVVSQTGWIRSLGGVEAYLALAARSTATIDQTTEAIAASDVQILPAVRGCIYLVPREHAALALRIADLLSARRNERDLQKAGVEPAELDTVGEAVLELIAEVGPLTTRQISSKLPDGVVRRLGDAGKKVGLSSTLPPALRQLEFAGRLSRKVQEDRLDHERYVWRIPGVNPLDDLGELSQEAAVHRELAELYFAWAGPATRKGFAAWAGIGQRDAKAAIAAADLTEVEVDEMGEAYISTDRVDAELAAPTELNWIPALDNIFALQEEATWLVDERHHDVKVAQFGRSSTRRFVEVNQPLQRTLFWDGRAAGLWAWDPAGASVESKVFDNVSAEADLVSGLERAKAVFDHFGHAKAFSLDKDATLAKRAELVRAAPGESLG